LVEADSASHVNHAKDHDAFLSALEARTGAVLWSAFIGGAGGTPVAYELDGRHYVVVGVNASGELPRFLAFVLDGAPVPEPATP
jgi:hypothetical protein